MKSPAASLSGIALVEFCRRSSEQGGGVQIKPHASSPAPGASPKSPPSVHAASRGSGAALRSEWYEGDCRCERRRCYHRPTRWRHWPRPAILHRIRHNIRNARSRRTWATKWREKKAAVQVDQMSCEALRPQCMRESSRSRRQKEFASTSIELY